VLDMKAVLAASALSSVTVTPKHALTGPANLPTHTQTLLEERANTWSAAFGMMGALGFALALLWRGDATPGQWIFAVTLFVLFLTSTVYHGLVSAGAKEIARVFDHTAIFALIAGTYTPFALGALRAHGGIWLFALEWLLALIGLAFVLRGGLDRTRVSNALYIGMGWIGLFFISGFLGNVAPIGNGLILAGGVIYTAGVAFYSARRLGYSHFIWHIFVLAGSACHAIAVYRYSG